MERSPILSPAGEPVFTIGGQDAHAVYVHHGWVVSLEWARSRRKHVRIMAIWPEGRFGMNGAPVSGAWTISETSIVHMLDATRDGKPTGGPTGFLLAQARAALPLLGKDANDRCALHSLVEVVVRFGPDLYMLPVVPQRMRERLAGAAMWDIQARAKSSGKIMSEVSV